MLSFHLLIYINNYIIQFDIYQFSNRKSQIKTLFNTQLLINQLILYIFAYNKLKTAYLRQMLY